MLRQSRPRLLCASQVGLAPASHDIIMRSWRCEDEAGASHCDEGQAQLTMMHQRAISMMEPKPQR